MEQYWQGIIVSLLTVVAVIILGSKNKDIGMLLTLFCCCAIGIMAFAFLSPVLSFLEKLRSLSKIDPELFNVLWKAVGIGFVGEIAGLVCTDAGNASMGKMVQLLTSCVMIWICIPLFESLVELVDTVLGGI